MSPDLLSVVVRALAFVALFQAAGTALFMALFGHTLTSALPAIRRLGLIAAAAGALLVFAHLSLDATRMAGDFIGVWDPDLQKLAWSSKSGISQIAQIAGLLITLAALAFSPGRSAALAGSAGALMTIGAFLLTGHTSVHPLRFALAPLLALHLLAAYNRWQLTPALFLGGTASDGTAAAGALRRSIAAEYLLIVAVLGVTAVLTAFFSPH